MDKEGKPDQQLLGSQLLKKTTRKRSAIYLPRNVLKKRRFSVEVLHPNASKAPAKVGDKVDVVCEGGIRRGTHVLKALSLGAKACSGGRMYLYALAAGGQKGVEKTLSNLRNEIERDMKLMGVSNISQLSQKNLRFR